MNTTTTIIIVSSILIVALDFYVRLDNTEHDNIAQKLIASLSVVNPIVDNSEDNDNEEDDKNDD